MTYRYFASIYEGCERAVFGKALQRCRLAFLERIQGKVLSAGEGDGRFCEALLAHHSQIDLKIIEPDEAMRDLIKKRIPNTRFTTLKETQACDVIVLNFVLDLFEPDNAKAFLGALPPAKTLIVGDFFPEEVHGFSSRTAAHGLVWIMYRCFNLLTKLKTRRLPPIREILESQGWICCEERVEWRGFIRAQRWERAAFTSSIA